MSRFGGLIGRKAILENRAGEAKPPGRPEPDGNVLELDPELIAPIANQVGKENEEVHNLLIDAEYRVSDLDAVKKSIAKLVEPVSKTLRAFEVAKSDRLSLQNRPVPADKLGHLSPAPRLMSVACSRYGLEGRV